jgi:predicted KAP-like P-loop ATPase
VKAANGQKAPFGQAQFSPIKRARYLQSKDAFEVEFEDGHKIVEPHERIRAANRISPTAKFNRLEIEDWTKSGFIGYYDTGETAEVSWSFLRELPPPDAVDQARSEPSYSSDRPIFSKDEDKLGRVEFASGLARDLRMWSGKDSLVVALYGEWGCGKTSIKNLLVEANQAAGAGALPIMEFNPWQLSRSGNIPTSFFRELEILLRTGARGEQAEKTAARLKVYAATLSLSGTAVESVGKTLPWVGLPIGPAVELAGKALKGAGTAAKLGSEAAKAEKEAASKTLADQKASIASALLQLQKPAVVVIDDIDRLTTDEILQVFQVVKANADFPRLIYLLLFDRGIIAKALDLVSGNKGHEFLEKIVQVGYHVPQASRSAIQKILFRGLDAELADQLVAKQWDKRRWSELYLEGISAYFKNLRHVYRFLSSFTFHVCHHKQTGSFEVNPIDLIGVEVLRVFEPNVYEQLPSAKTILTRDGGTRIFGDVKQEVVDEAVGQIVARATEGNVDRVRTIVQQLFPPIGSGYGTRSEVTRHHHEWLRQLRICHPDFFDRYFTLAIGENDLAQAEIDRLINSTNDSKEFETVFRSLTARGLQKLMLERLDAYKEVIPIANLPQLTIALCNVSDELPLRTPGMFELDPLSGAWRLVYFGLKREPDENQRFEVLKTAITKSQGLALPTDIASMEERTDEREARGHEFLVSEDHARQLRQLCVQKFKHHSKEPSFAKNPRLNAFLWWWSQWGDLQEVRQWIEQRTRTPKGVVWFLLVALGESHSWGGDHRVRYFIELSTIERYADVDRIRSLAARINRNKLPKKEQTALRELDKAFARREEGKSDKAWQNDFGTPDDEIVET